MRRHLATAITMYIVTAHLGACLTLPILCYFGPTDYTLPQFSRDRSWKWSDALRLRQGIRSSPPTA